MGSCPRSRERQRCGLGLGLPLDVRRRIELAQQAATGLRGFSMPADARIELGSNALVVAHLCEANPAPPSQGSSGVSFFTVN